MFGLPSDKRRALGAVLFRALVLAFASVWLPSAASALELVWSAPASCPGQADMQQRIDSLLGPSARTSARANATISETRAGYQLKLTLSGAGIEGSRRLSGKDCQALAESAAFLIAVAIDPSLPGTQPEPTAPPTPPADVTPTADGPVPAPAPVAPAPRPRLAATPRLWLHAAAFGGLWRSLEPTQVQLGGALGTGLDAGYERIAARHQIELRAAYALEVGRTVQGPLGGGTFSTSSTSVELAVCELYTPRHFFVGACFVAAGTRTHGDGDDFEREESGTLYWANLGLSVQAGMVLTGWPMPFVEAGAVTAVTPRPSFTIGGIEPIESDRVVFHGRIGVRFDWQHSLQDRQP